MKSKPMATLELLTILLIGLGAGLLSGLVGIGGGVIMVPALVFFLHYSQHQAQGTSLAVLTLPVVLLASYTYYTECKKMGTPVDLHVVGLLAITFILGAFGGSLLAVKIEKDLLKKIFGLVLLYTAFKMFNWDVLLQNWIRAWFR